MTSILSNELSFNPPDLKGGHDMNNFITVFKKTEIDKFQNDP